MLGEHRLADVCQVCFRWGAGLADLFSCSSRVSRVCESMNRQSKRPHEASFLLLPPISGSGRSLGDQCFSSPSRHAVERCSFLELTNAEQPCPRSSLSCFQGLLFFLCTLLNLSVLLACPVQVRSLKSIALLLGVP